MKASVFLENLAIALGISLPILFFIARHIIRKEKREEGKEE